MNQYPILISVQLVIKMDGFHVRVTYVRTLGLLVTLIEDVKRLIPTN